MIDRPIQNAIFANKKNRIVPEEATRCGSIRKVGLAGLESLKENTAFSVVKSEDGRSVVPRVVPIHAIPAELSMAIHQLDATGIRELSDFAIRKLADGKSPRTA